MSFAHPAYLGLLGAVALLVPWLAWRRRRQGARWRALGQPARRAVDRSAVWVLALGCLAVALAQPRWGHAPGPPLPPGHDVVLLIDVSRSMAARDAVPNRLSLASEMASGLVRALGREPGSRAAVVVFAGRGRERCPLTSNLGAVVDVLGSLRAGEVQPGGTNLGAALQAAADTFDPAEHAEGRTVVLFSDGEDHAGTWEERLDELRTRAVVVHTVAIGDAAQGASVPSGQGTQPLRYQGEAVVSRRDDAPLEAIARATGGACLRLGMSHADLGQLYLTRIAPVARRQRQALQPPEQAERYAWFVLAALCLGVRASWPGGRFAGAGRWLAVAGLVLLTGARPADGNFYAALAEGRTHFRAGRFVQALAAFERANTIDPTSPVALYDSAATLFRLERYPDAYVRYAAARERAGPKLRTKVDYALGNTALALGDVAAAIRHYDACLASGAGGADRVRRDARINRAYAEQLPTPPQSRPDQAPPRSPARSRNESQRPGEREPSPDSSPDTPSAERSADAQPGGRSGNAAAAEPSADRAPQERLDEALDQIRAEAERRRIPEEPTAAPEVDRKEW